eukprot:2425176-Pyramimonas_sp.AAC.1
MASKTVPRRLQDGQRGRRWPPRCVQDDQDGPKKPQYSPKVAFKTIPICLQDRKDGPVKP